jgi:hypothetical protein
MIGTIIAMPITVFDIKGVPGNRRERIEAALVGGGKRARGPYEAWIAADPIQGRLPRRNHGPTRVSSGKLYDSPGGAIPPIGHLQLVPHHLTY